LNVAQAEMLSLPRRNADRDCHAARSSGTTPGYDVRDGTLKSARIKRNPGARQRGKDMHKHRRHPVIGKWSGALAAALLSFASGVQAEKCEYEPVDAYEAAKDNGFQFRCIAYYEEKNITQASDFTLFPDGSIGCSGQTPNELGLAWIYLNLFSREAGLGSNWELWHYEVTGLPHTRIGDGAPIRLITTMLGPNARYEVKITKMVLINPYRKCTNALREAFG
jgi:hypothetical protein